MTKGSEIIVKAESIILPKILSVEPVVELCHWEQVMPIIHLFPSFFVSFSINTDFNSIGKTQLLLVGKIVIFSVFTGIIDSVGCNP